MTDQERLKAFNAELGALLDKYGIALRSIVVAKQYGDMIQIEPSNDVKAVTIDNWQPPAPPELNGKDSK